MGCFSSPKPPQVDQEGLIQAQADANRFNQYTPFGSSTWTQGSGGQWSNDVQLNPMVQQQLTNQQQLGVGGSQAALNMLPQAFQQMSGGFNPNGAASQKNITGSVNFGQAPTGGPIQNTFGNPQATGSVRPTLNGGMKLTDLNGVRLQNAGSTNAGERSFDRFNAPEFDLQKAFSMAYDPQLALLQPELDRQRSREETRLASQGVTLGSDAYGNARNILDSGQNDALTRLSANAFGQGLGAQAQQYGQASNTWGNNFNASNTEVQNRLQQQQLNNQAAMANSQNALSLAGMKTGQDALRAGIAGQEFGQNLASAQLQNQTAGQNYAQNQGLAAFGNQAQAQGFNQAYAPWAQQGQFNLANAAMGNQAQQQAYNQQLNNYGMPLQTLSAFNSLNQPNTPSFASPTTLDVMGPAGLNMQGQLAAYGGQAGAQQGLMGGLFGLGGGLLNFFGGA